MTNLTHTSPKPSPAALAVDPSKVILPQQYPAWTDGHGWNQPQQYKTIQVGDIDGDGIDELIGRGPNGIEVYKWGQTTHIWELLSGVGPFSDKDGWTTPERYLNIILADINGDKKAELIGLNEHKLQVYSWDATQHVWNELCVDTALPSSWAWDAKSRIQAADLNGDGKDELVLHVVDFLGKIAWSDSKQWSVDEAPGLKWLKADMPILLGDIDGDGKAEFVQFDKDEVQAFRWVGKQLESISYAGDPFRFNQPVQLLADVDGDGKAELITYGLIQPFYQIHVYHYETGDNGISFKLLNRLTQYEGLQEDEYFLTAQFADIDGDGKAELIARSPEGLIAYRYQHNLGGGGGPEWTFDYMISASATGVMADADGWNAPQCYLTIQTARIGGGGIRGLPNSPSSVEARTESRPGSGRPIPAPPSRCPAGRSPSWDFAPRPSTAFISRRSPDFQTTPTVPANSTRISSSASTYLT
jgi:hypothetical protein